MKPHVEKFIDSFNRSFEISEILNTGFSQHGSITELQKKELEFELIEQTKDEINSGVLITKGEFKEFLNEFHCDFEIFNSHYSQLYIILNEPCSYM